MPLDHSVSALSSVVRGACRAGLRGRPTSTAATVTPVLAAVWCRSVGTTWTVELHKLDRGTALGTTVDWISSGVPTSQPQPDEQTARELLAGRGLHLYLDPTAGPCTHSRYRIGYVCTDAQVIALAHRLHEVAVTTGIHPVTLAARRIAAQLSPAG